jgi:hypothetical protein
LPEEKILFQADMLTVAHDQIASPPGNAGTVLLDEAVDCLGLKIEYVAGAHGVPGTRYELQRAGRQNGARQSTLPSGCSGIRRQTTRE